MKEMIVENETRKICNYLFLFLKDYLKLNLFLSS